MKKHEFQVTLNGITFHYDRCEHCGKLPTDGEIQAQLNLIQKEYGEPCAVCGKKAQITEALLLHYKQGGIDRWGGQVTAISNLAELSGYVEGRSVQIKIHPDCALAALPYAIIADPHPYCGQCGTLFKNGDVKTWADGLRIGIHHPHPLCDSCVQKNHDSTYTKA